MKKEFSSQTKVMVAVLECGKVKQTQKNAKISKVTGPSGSLKDVQKQTDKHMINWISYAHKMK